MVAQGSQPVCKKSTKETVHCSLSPRRAHHPAPTYRRARASGAIRRRRGSTRPRVTADIAWVSQVTRRQGSADRPTCTYRRGVSANDLLTYLQTSPTPRRHPADLVRSRIRGRRSIGQPNAVRGVLARPRLPRKRPQRADQLSVHQLIRPRTALVCGMNLALIQGLSMH